MTDIAKDGSGEQKTSQKASPITQPKDPDNLSNGFNERLREILKSYWAYDRNMSDDNSKEFWGAMEKQIQALLSQQVVEAREIFVPIHRTEGRYEVSNLGRVRSVAGGKRKGGVLVQSIRGKKAGYKVISLYKGKEVMSVNVHRLVANAFISNPDDKPCVNHKDGDKTNNHVENLEWCTYSENELHSFRVLGKINGNHPQRFVGTDKRPTGRPKGIKETKPRNRIKTLKAEREKI